MAITARAATTGQQLRLVCAILGMIAVPAGVTLHTQPQLCAPFIALLSYAMSGTKQDSSSAVLPLISMGPR